MAALKNTVKTDLGVEVYENKIMELADEYLDDNDIQPEDLRKTSSLFNGMIKYIYINLFKNHPLNYGNIEKMDEVFNIYTSLCYKYNKRPTILNFSILIGIDRDTLNSWKNGEFRGDSSSAHSVTVKKWLKECESALLDGAIEQNSIGCIFALKANYGYAETAPVPAVNAHQMQSIEQVKEQYKLETAQDIEFPDGDF